MESILRVSAILKKFTQNLQTITVFFIIYNISSDDNDDILVGHNQDWFRLRDNEWFKVNENNGYRAQYAYCQDIRGFLTFPWIPILSWIVLTWLPFILLTIIQNISNLKILLDLPGIPLMSILSNFQIGPRNVNGRRYYCLSTAASVVNIVLTLASVACVIHLVTTGFGPGDGRGLRFCTIDKFSLMQFDNRLFLLSSGLSSPS